MNVKNKSGTKNNYDYLFKCLISGDSRTGKTAFLQKYCDDSFPPNYLTTIGIDFKAKTTPFEEKVFRTQIWDTAGAERFRPIVEAYYKVIQGVIVMYSVTDRKSFLNVEKWMKDLFAGVPLDAVFVLVGNKCDEENREVKTSEGKEMADSYDMPFFEASAKEGINVSEAFQELMKQFLSKKKA